MASLVDSMLEDYISAEISLSAQSNRRMTRVVILSAVLEVLILLGALLLSARMGRRVAGLIRSPIERLEHFARHDGRRQPLRPRAATDLSELKHLTEGINIMADRLESLIAQNRQEQENLRKSELRTLQAQINPHFLYNTLDAIVWQAEAGHSGEGHPHHPRAERLFPHLAVLRRGLDSPGAGAQTPFGLPQHSEGPLPRHPQLRDRRACRPGRELCAQAPAPAAGGKRHLPRHQGTGAAAASSP